MVKRVRTKTRSPLNSVLRREAGCIVSLSTDAGDRRTVHMYGGIKDALSAIAAECDARPSRWYIDAISTPESVLRDISGQSASPFYMERQALSQIGRLDMLRSPLQHPEYDSTKGRGHAWRSKRIVRPKQP